MEEVSIRPALLSDADALTAALKAAYAPFEGLEGLPDVTAGIAADIANHRVWVAEGSAGIVGGVVLSVEGDEAHLINLGVSPDGAGKGLGRKLVDTALTAARKVGANSATLGTHRDMTATRSFYARLGWSEVETDGLKVTLHTKL